VAILRIFLSGSMTRGTMSKTFPIATTEQTANDIIVFDQDRDWSSSSVACRSHRLRLGSMGHTVRAATVVCP